MSRLSWQRRRRRRELDLSIRPRQHWAVRWAPLLLAVVGIAAAWEVMPRLLAMTGSPLALAGQVTALTDERDRLRAALQARDSELAVQAAAREQDRAARASLLQELTAVREEALHLKGDLAALRNLGHGTAAPVSAGTAASTGQAASPGAAQVPASGATAAPGAAVHLSGFSVHPGAVPGEYRWHLLVAQEGTQQAGFAGRIRLRLEGPGQLVAGADGMPDRAQGMAFKYYQDLDGMVRVAGTGQGTRLWAEVWREGQARPVASASAPLP